MSVEMAKFQKGRPHQYKNWKSHYEWKACQTIMHNGIDPIYDRRNCIYQSSNIMLKNTYIHDLKRVALAFTITPKYPLGL